MCDEQCEGGNQCDTADNGEIEREGLHPYARAAPPGGGPAGRSIWTRGRTRISMPQALQLVISARRTALQPGQARRRGSPVIERVAPLGRGLRRGRHTVDQPGRAAALQRHAEGGRGGVRVRKLCSAFGECNQAPAATRGEEPEEDEGCNEEGRRMISAPSRG